MDEKYFAELSRIVIERGIGGKRPNRVVIYADEIGTIPKIAALRC